MLGLRNLKLTEMQKKVLEEIVESGITDGFYLAGGTALMMKYGHRFSEDFDFFSLPEIKMDFGKLAANLKDIMLLDEKYDTLIFQKYSVRCSFFQYEYPLVKPPVLEQEYQIMMASDEDIASMKTVAIIQRGEKKDFFDLWYLMNLHNWRIRDVIRFSELKYGEKFNPSILLKAVIFFEDAERDIIGEIDLRWEEVKNYFLNEVKAEVSC